jgi:SAM-dependent methyltransferase
MVAIRPYSHDATNARVLELLLRRPICEQRVVDVGAGEGYFSQFVGEHVKRRCNRPAADVLSACDLYPDSFRYPDICCSRIDIGEPLPYADCAFDTACSLEVIEHVEDQFFFVRELFRIVKPGGRVIVTTPNVSNINSRLRNLHSGFAQLFHPLPLHTNEPVHTSGHIHPIGLYHLAYLFHRAGFRTVALHPDRQKTSGAIWTILLSLIVFPASWAATRKFRRRSPAVYAENAALLRDLNSWRMLTSRSVIVEATR